MVLQTPEARPVFIVFVKDQFEVVRAAELERRDLEEALSRGW